MLPGSSRHRSRPRVRRGSAAADLRLEALEPRRLCVGDVTSRLVGSTLLIAGDRQDNRIVVSAVKGGGIAVIGDGTSINGSATPFVTHRRVTAVVAKLGAGDDVVAFTNDMFAIQLLYPGDVDAIQDVIGAATNGELWFSLPGSITVFAGAGDDRVFLVGEVAGSLVTHLGPSSTLASNAGNSLNLVSSVFPPPVGRRVTLVRGSLIVTGGNGTDSVGTDHATIGGSLTSHLGGGANSTYLFYSSVGRDLVVTGTAGPDVVGSSDLDVAHSIVLLLGRGDNTIAQNLGRSTRIVVGTGDGNDDVRFLQQDVRDAVKVALGAGDDALELRTVRAQAAFLTGGPGFNALDLDAATRSGVRRLRFMRFQTVSG